MLTLDRMGGMGGQDPCKCSFPTKSRKHGSIPHTGCFVMTILSKTCHAWWLQGYGLSHTSHIPAPPFSASLATSSHGCRLQGKIRCTSSTIVSHSEVPSNGRRRGAKSLIVQGAKAASLSPQNITLQLILIAGLRIAPPHLAVGSFVLQLS